MSFLLAGDFWSESAHGRAETAQLTGWRHRQLQEAVNV
jgi:hypothetical protein